MNASNESIDREDHRARRCPMLGHQINFAYCRKPGRDTPCGKVFDCWWEAFDVESFIRQHHSDAEIANILAPRKDKVLSLVEVIRQARQRTQGDS